MTMKPSDMVNLRRSSKNKNNNNVVGRVKHDASCKKHPKHQQSPGVCSLCLGERLSNLSSSSTSHVVAPSSATSSSVSSLSSYYSSSSASSCASPNSEARPAGSSTSIFLFSSKHGVINSRSMASSSSTSAKSRGFLFNLLRPRQKKSEHRDNHQLVRCGSVTQNVTVAG